MQEPETNAEAPASSECISQVADNKQIMMTVKKGESHLIQIQSEMVLLKKKKEQPKLTQHASDMRGKYQQVLLLKTCRGYC